MTSIDEILATMDYKDYIHDDIQFVIDSDLRTIAIPDNGVVIGVVGDKNVNRVNFKMDRYYDGFDMAKFIIRINYANANGQVNYYTVDDMLIEEDKLLFSWLVESDATAYAGKVNFVVRLIRLSGSTILQSFNAQLSSAKVLDGLVVDNYITPEQQFDILTHLKSDLDTYSRDVVIPSIPEDYTSLSSDVERLKNEAGKKCEILRNISIYVDTEDHTVSVKFDRTALRCLLFSNERWYAPLEIDPEMSDVIIDYSQIVLTNMTVVLIYDITDNTFKLKQMSAYKFVDTDIMLFFAYIDRVTLDLIFNTFNAYCNNIYLDGVMQTHSSSEQILLDVTKLQSDVSKKCELLRNININMDTENHTINVDFTSTGIGCLIYAKDRWYAPLNLFPGMTDVTIDYSEIVTEPKSIVFLYDLNDRDFKIKHMGYDKFYATDILLFFAFVSYPSYKVVGNVFNAYCNNVYLDGKLQTPSMTYQAKQEIGNLGYLESLNKHTCRIFKKVVCCGDSYTSGYVKLNGEVTAKDTNEEFAWPHFMSSLTGNEWFNCGCSGCNVLTWHTHPRGLPAAQMQGKAQAYVIGLMINDVSDTDRAVELGTMDDIGEDCTVIETYYAGLSSIIRELNTISPKAKIFVNTCPKTGDKYTMYNQAVRDIVSAYKAKYPVHCVDLETVKEYYDISSIKNDFINGHYTAICYEQLAEIYEYVLSDYINNHVSDFQNVHEIYYE